MRSGCASASRGLAGDAPTSSAPHPVDLDSVLGPRCTNLTAGSGQCCYLPLGYGGGPPLGTDCEQACATTYHWGMRTHRIGNTAAYCVDSSKKYGNWCVASAQHPARAREGPASVAEPPRIDSRRRSFCGPKFAINGEI